MHANRLMPNVYRKKLLAFTEAAKWLRMAAVQDCPDAEYTLGRMYLNGVGVEENRDEGLKLIREAWEHGKREAKALLSELPGGTAHLEEK